MRNSKKKDKLYEYGKDVALDFRILDRNDKDMCKAFSCGSSHIDAFVKRQSYKQIDCITYGAIDTSNGKLVSIISLQCTGIYTKHNALSRWKDKVIPAIEIVYFATDERYQAIPYSERVDDYSLSYQIFVYYMKEIVDISKKVIGAKKIVLYAVEDAVKFYKKSRFKDFEPYMVVDKNEKVSKCTPMFFSLNQ